MSHTKRRRWTAEEDARIAELSAAGMTVPAIAAAIGRTFRSTAQRLERRGVRSPKQRAWSSAELRRARRLYDTGYSAREIAVMIGRSTPSVRRALGRHGGLDVRRRGDGHRKSDTRVYDLKRRGLTFREVVHVLGMEDTPAKRRGLAAWFRRYCKRANLRMPEVQTRRSFDAERVHRERVRLGLDAPQPKS